MQQRHLWVPCRQLAESESHPATVGRCAVRKVVAGALVNNIWSFAGWGPKEVNSMTLQPFSNYNFPGGGYLTNSPIITRIGMPIPAGMC